MLIKAKGLWDSVRSFKSALIFTLGIKVARPLSASLSRAVELCQPMDGDKTALVGVHVFCIVIAALMLGVLDRAFAMISSLLMLIDLIQACLMGECIDRKMLWSSLKIGLWDNGKMLVLIAWTIWVNFLIIGWDEKNSPPPIKSLLVWLLLFCGVAATSGMRNLLAWMGA